MICPLCETPLTHKLDDFYYACQECEAIVKNSQYYLSSSAEKERYQEHNNDVQDVFYQQFTSPITHFILDNYSQNHLGLDYGCGTGPVISSQLQKEGFQVKLYDPFFYPDESYLNHTYDYIFSCEVFEHFYQPKLEIEKLLSLLKSNGRLIIMTHQFEGDISFSNWYYRKDPTHVFIYTKNTFEYIAKKYRLIIENQTNRLIILKK